jgi:hypothetical protein
MPPKASRQKQVKRGEINQAVRSELHRWRMLIKKCDFHLALFRFEAMLPDEIVDLLSSAGPIKTRKDLSIILSEQWGWEPTYGDELHSKLTSLNITPQGQVPKSKPSTVGVKRRVDVGTQENVVMEKPSKRLRPP